MQHHSLKQEHLQLVAQLAKLKLRMLHMADTIDSEVQDAVDAITNLETAIGVYQTNVQTKLAAQDSTIAALENQIKTNPGDIAALQSLITGVRSQTDAVNAAANVLVTPSPSPAPAPSPDPSPSPTPEPAPAGSEAPQTV